jgi:hypothetical protein
VGYVGHVGHFGLPGARNVDALLFMFKWNHNGYDEKGIGTRYTKVVFSIRWELQVT